MCKYTPQSLAQYALLMVKAAAEENLCIRLYGGVAIWQHCPGLRSRIEATRPRQFKDMDFIGLLSEQRAIERFFARWNWKQDRGLAAVPGVRRALFYRKEGDRIIALCDVSYDLLDFCHPIDCVARIAIDPVTIPLAELVLSKLQVRELSQNDMFDLSMLFLDHQVGNVDHETINEEVVSRMCASDWGLYKTVSCNIDEVNRATTQWLTSIEGELVRERLAKLQRSMDTRPKTLKWRMRSLVGARMQWYRDIDPIEPSSGSCSA